MTTHLFGTFTPASRVDSVCSNVNMFREAKIDLKVIKNASCISLSNAIFGVCFENEVGFAKTGRPTQNRQDKAEGKER